MKIEATPFLQTLHLTLKSGKNLSEGLKLMEGFGSDTDEHRVYSAIRQDLQRGIPFSEAFGTHVSAPRDIVQFIGMAEKGAAFGTMLARVLHYLEMKEKFYRESNDKIALPILYFMLSTLIVLFVRFYAIPDHIHESLQYDPAIQKLIADHLSIAQTMGDALFGLLLMSGSYFLIVMVALFSQKEVIQGIAKPVALILPVSSKLLRHFEKFLLLTLLGEMLQNGISFKRAIESAQISTDVTEFKEGFEEMLQRVTRGEHDRWKISFFEELEQRLLMGAGSMKQAGAVMVQLAEHARLNALMLGSRFFRLISVISILLMALAVFVEFFTVVLTQVLIQKGMISAVDGVQGAF